MASYTQIAKQAGVSITTVSRALNNDPAVNADTRRRVLAVANRAGYVATMGRRVTTQIGFTYTGEPSIAHAFDSAVLEGITRGLFKCRFDVVVVDLQRDKLSGESYTQFFMRRGVRGVILRTDARTRDVCKAIAEEGFPHVVIADRFEEPQVNYIDGESRPDSLRAVEYLIDLGHRRIAFGMHNVPDRDHADRFEGYRAALARHGLAYDESLVFRQHWSLAGGATALKMAVSMPDPPTAIYFADPMLAIGAVKQSHEIGVRIPGDLSIIGFDDTDLRFGVHPTLTAVCQDARNLGFEAADYLAARLTQATDGPLRRSAPTYFEIHDTTSAPRKGRIPVSVSTEPAVSGRNGSRGNGARRAESALPSEGARIPEGGTRGTNGPLQKPDTLKSEAGPGRQVTP